MIMAGVVLCMEEYMMILLGGSVGGVLLWFSGLGGKVACWVGWR